MIKSPCKSCKKYKKEFPNCFSTCCIIHELQLIIAKRKYCGCETNRDYDVREDLSILIWENFK